MLTYKESDAVGGEKATFKSNLNVAFSDDYVSVCLVSLRREWISSLVG